MYLHPILLTSFIKIPVSIFFRIDYLCHVMPRTKYKFNPDSLSFDRISLGIKELLLRFLAYFIGSIIVALIYWVVFAAFLIPPGESAPTGGGTVDDSVRPYSKGDGQY